jgi:hypothetical protein
LCRVSLSRDVKFFGVQVFYPDEITLFLETVQAIYNQFTKSNEKAFVSESLNLNGIVYANSMTKEEERKY